MPPGDVRELNEIDTEDLLAGAVYSTMVVRSLACLLFWLSLLPSSLLTFAVVCSVHGVIHSLEILYRFCTLQDRYDNLLQNHE